MKPPKIISPLLQVRMLNQRNRRNMSFMEIAEDWYDGLRSYSWPRLNGEPLAPTWWDLDTKTQDEWAAAVTNCILNSSDAHERLVSSIEHSVMVGRNAEITDEFKLDNFGPRGVPETVVHIETDKEFKEFFGKFKLATPPVVKEQKVDVMKFIQPQFVTTRSGTTTDEENNVENYQKKELRN